MKTLFLTIAAPVLLVTLGFGQTPTPTSTDPASIKGCLGGSEGNYTVAEDGTTQTFKVTSSTVDLKPHVGHDIAVTGQKTIATSSGPADNSVAITGVDMISEQCTPATTSASPAPASAPTVADSTPAAPTSAPVVADTTPAATTTTPVAVDPAPAAASTPVAADPAPVAVASTPVVADPPPTVAASAPAQTVTAPDDSKQLPNTATSLPLVGLLGLGMLGLGLWNRKSRTS